MNIISNPSTLNATPAVHIAAYQQSPDSEPDIDAFSTVSGSTYQVQLESCRVRRLENLKAHAPVRYQAADGQWQHYVAVEVVAWPPTYSPRIALRFWWEPTSHQDPYLVTSAIMRATPRVRLLLDTATPLDLEL